MPSQGVQTKANRWKHDPGSPGEGQKEDDKYVQFWYVYYK